jgi:hypothetical protein
MDRSDVVYIRIIVGVADSIVTPWHFTAFMSYFVARLEPVPCQFENSFRCKVHIITASLLACPD